MILKDLRPVLSEQVDTNVTVVCGDDTVTSGKMWLFNVDDSVDDLKVIEIYPEDSILEIKIKCDPERFKETDWSNTFNKKVIENTYSGSTDTITQE